MELLSHPLWRDKNAVLQALDETIPSCDESRSDAYSLAVRLAALGARVTVAARRPVQRAMAEELGLRAVPLTELAAEAAAFDTVVNTIPAPVLTAQVLAALPKKSLIVDLASKPGGTDFAAARRLGHTALHALSLPTVWAPETAGEALARTVQAILQEREGTV